MPKRKLLTGAECAITKVQKPNHFSMSLKDSMRDPNLVLKSDDLIVIIKDKYPKAQFHFLVLPKENISNLKSVTKQHLKLLEHMESAGLELTKIYKDNTFKLGYHAEPSMNRLHLHIISDDMNSKWLKTKKHWNTFTTGFFLESNWVIESLKENGRVILPSREKCKEFMELALQCHKCGIGAKNMPQLKRHILTHIS